MTKTQDDILDDFMGFVTNSPLKTAITGAIYKDETFRPINSDKEDILINFLTGLDGQIQDGVVNVHIYVNDIAFQGRKVRDVARCRSLEAIARDVFKRGSLGDYYLPYSDTIKVFPAENNQHYINVRVRFRFQTS